MTEIRFYHMMQKKLEKALPEIAGKALERGYRIVIKTADSAQAEMLDTALWTFDAASFLPHGREKDGFESEQPIFVTTQDDNPNGARMLMLTFGATSPVLDKYDLCCELFDGNDDEAVAAARSRWKEYKEKGYNLAYFQQNDEGKWEKKA